jgi:hypothetical protein
MTVKGVVCLKFPHRRRRTVLPIVRSVADRRGPRKPSGSVAVPKQKVRKKGATPHRHGVVARTEAAAAAVVPMAPVVRRTEAVAEVVPRTAAAEGEQDVARSDRVPPTERVPQEDLPRVESIAPQVRKTGAKAPADLPHAVLSDLALATRVPAAVVAAVVAVDTVGLPVDLTDLLAQPKAPKGTPDRLDGPIVRPMRPKGAKETHVRRVDRFDHDSTTRRAKGETLAADRRADHSDHAPAVDLRVRVGVPGTAADDQATAVDVARLATAMTDGLVGLSITRRQPPCRPMKPPLHKRRAIPAIRKPRVTPPPRQRVGIFDRAAVLPIDDLETGGLPSAIDRADAETMAADAEASLAAGTMIVHARGVSSMNHRTWATKATKHRPDVRPGVARPGLRAAIRSSNSSRGERDFSNSSLRSALSIATRISSKPSG